MICTFGFLWNCSRSERIRFLLFPQMITACSPFSSRETSSCASRCTFAESHTAAHDEKQRSILGKTEMAAHILFGCRARKCGPHRNTERKQFFFRDAAGCKLRDQILVRNHIVIAVRLFPERNARVIGGNGNAGNRQPSFLFQPGQCFRRIKMCGDNGIKMVLINIICKRISKPRICVVNGGFQGNFRTSSPS